MVVDHNLVVGVGRKVVGHNQAVGVGHKVVDRNRVVVVDHMVADRRALVHLEELLNMLASFFLIEFIFLCFNYLLKIKIKNIN